MSADESNLIRSELLKRMEKRMEKRIERNEEKNVVVGYEGRGKYDRNLSKTDRDKKKNKHSLSDKNGNVQSDVFVLTEHIPSLGKRGRRYTDIWNEEDFIYKSKQENIFKVVTDWSELINNYSDTYDGTYADWSHHQRILLINSKRQIKIQIINLYMTKKVFLSSINCFQKLSKNEIFIYCLWLVKHQPRRLP